MNSSAMHKRRGKAEERKARRLKLMKKLFLIALNIINKRRKSENKIRLKFRRTEPLFISIGKIEYI